MSKDVVICNSDHFLCNLTSSGWRCPFPIPLPTPWRAGRLLQGTRGKTVARVRFCVVSCGSFWCLKRSLKVLGVAQEKKSGTTEDIRSSETSSTSLSVLPGWRQQKGSMVHNHVAVDVKTHVCIVLRGSKIQACEEMANARWRLPGFANLRAQWLLDCVSYRTGVTRSNEFFLYQQGSSFSKKIMRSERGGLRLCLPLPSLHSGKVAWGIGACRDGLWPLSSGLLVNKDGLLFSFLKTRLAATFVQSGNFLAMFTLLLWDLDTSVKCQGLKLTPLLAWCCLSLLRNRWRHGLSSRQEMT